MSEGPTRTQVQMSEGPTSTNIKKAITKKTPYQTISLKRYNCNI
jgi:hypothetical protein